MPQNLLTKTLSLDGAWDFALGQPQHWGPILVPGCWEAQGYAMSEEGPAFYRRTIDIPADWAGERIFIEFNAVSYACQVRCNGAAVGEHRGLWTPFSLEITSAARPGCANLIELEVVKPGNRYPMRGSLAGFLPDVATTFGGLWQSARLYALTIRVEDLLVDPDPGTGQVRVRCRAAGLGWTDGPYAWRMGVYAGAGQVSCQELTLVDRQSPEAGQDSDCALDATLSVPEPELWSPDHPALYELRLELLCAGRVEAAVSQRFGFRRLAAHGGLLTLNGQPIILRGVLSWGWQPDCIAPAYTPERARDEIRRVKSLGFNLIKLCLFVPDQVYFDVADEEGVFLWQEMPLWLPEVTPDLRASAPGEYAAITRLTRHHPAVVLYSLGCELNRSVDAAFLDQLNDAVRGLLSDVLVCDNSGSGESYGGLDFDFSDFTDYHPYFDLHYFEPLLDHWRRDWLPARPWIFGEFSDSDGYRDLDGLKAAHQGRMPWWATGVNPVTHWRPEAQALVEADKRLAQAGIALPPAELVRIAAAQSLTARKYTLEALRRRAGMGGYVVTGLRDTPIATSGVFDDFDRPKSPAEAWKMFNENAILCLDTGRRRRWSSGGDRPDRQDVYNHWAGPDSTATWQIILSAFGDQPADDSELVWRLCRLDGTVLAGGQSGMRGPVQAGVPTRIASITCPLPEVAEACELRLEASLVGRGQSAMFRRPGVSGMVSNAWPVWVYPQVTWPAGLGVYDPGCALDSLPELVSQARCLEAGTQGSRPPGGDWDVPLVVAAAWSERLEAYLRSGGRVLLLQQGDAPLPAQRGPFWREGLKFFPDHPLWRVFPQQGFAGLQFFGLASDVVLDTARLCEALPGISAIRPVLRRLDEREFYVRDYLLEARLGSGRLLACSLRLQGGAGAQPAGLKRNAAGAYLLWAMLDYLQSRFGDSL